MDLILNTKVTASNGMSWTQFCFHFDGRIGRREFWLGLLAVILVNAVLIFALIMLFGKPYTGPERTPGEVITQAVPGCLVFLALVALFWPWFAISAKGWHDLDSSGLWNLLLLVGVVNILVVLYLGLAPGTPGVNRFGPPPR